jgi:hypothetical protein
MALTGKAGGRALAGRKPAGRGPAPTAAAQTEAAMVSGCGRAGRLQPRQAALTRSQTR